MNRRYSPFFGKNGNIVSLQAVTLHPELSRRETTTGLFECESSFSLKSSYSFLDAHDGRYFGIELENVSTVSQGGSNHI